MKLLQLSAFRAVMLTGTISGAGEVLKRSQPAVSRLLQKLECELGVALFERRKGLVTPTPAAHLLLEEIERVYDSLDHLRSFATRLAKGEGAELNLAVMPTLGINFMPDVLARFRETWPKTKVILSVRLSTKIEQWAAAQQIDLGIAETPFRRSGFRMEIFSNAPYVAAVPTGHPLADHPSIKPKDLEQGPLISWTSFVAARQLLDQALSTAGVTVNAAYETSFSASAYELVKRGLGVAIIDPFTAVQQLDPRVRLIPFVPSIPFNVALLYPERRSLNPATTQLLEIAVQERDKVLHQLQS